jgi:hypothetical protein
LRIWATPQVAYHTPSRLRRQLRRTFHAFMCAKACSTRARIRLCTVLRSCFQPGSGLPPAGVR